MTAQQASAPLAREDLLLAWWLLVVVIKIDLALRDALGAETWGDLGDILRAQARRQQ